MKAVIVLLIMFLCGAALFVAGCPRAERLEKPQLEEGTTGGADQGTDQGTDQGSGQSSSELSEVPGEIDVFPGATRLGSGREVTVTGVRIDGTIDGSTYHADADYEEVAEWYRDELTGELELTATLSSELRSGRGTIFVLLSGTGIGAAVTVAAADDGPGTTINIGVWDGTIREGGQ